MELAELQDAEVGDGTTSVVILAAELLKRANELVRNKIHPTNIISGYRLAMREVRRRMHPELLLRRSSSAQPSAVWWPCAQAGAGCTVWLQRTCSLADGLGA